MMKAYVWQSLYPVPLNMDRCLAGIRELAVFPCGDAPQGYCETAYTGVLLAYP
jgi:hypothetical protein